jgi:flagellar hook-basal body complex protein FliE
MTGGIQNLGNLVGAGSASRTGSSPAPASGSDFASVLKKSIDEVSRLQQDASDAVESAMTGQTDDMTGVMTAVEKSDLAFKTLLAIRSKLMEAYDEVKNMQV